MTDFWHALDAPVRGGILFGLYLFPALAIGALVRRGYRPGPLVRAMIWRFRWANLLFVLLIAISIGIGVGLLAQERGLRRGLAAAAGKFDLVIAAPGSEVTMLLAAVYLQPSDVPLLSGEIFNEVASDEKVALAAPIGFGDSYGSSPVVGTTAEFARYLTDDRIEGRVFIDRFEALVGATVDLNPGDSFTPSHGAGQDAPAGGSFAVVGRLGPTGSPWDRAILVPIEAVWERHGLAGGHAPDRGERIGPPFDADHFPGTPAIIVHAEELWATYALRSQFNRESETMAFLPAAVLAQLYAVMGDVRQVMSLMSLVTQVLVAASVLAGLLILIRLFRRQLALLRALGAPARFVFAVVWSYAAALLLAGSGLGLLLGQLATSALSALLTERTDILIRAPLGWPELQLAAAFLSATSLLALLPAATVLRLPIAESLRA